MQVVPRTDPTNLYNMAPSKQDQDNAWDPEIRILHILYKVGKSSQHNIYDRDLFNIIFFLTNGFNIMSIHLSLISIYLSS